MWDRAGDSWSLPCFHGLDSSRWHAGRALGCNPSGQCHCPLTCSVLDVLRESDRPLVTSLGLCSALLTPMPHSNLVVVLRLAVEVPALRFGEPSVIPAANCCTTWTAAALPLTCSPWAPAAALRRLFDMLIFPGSDRLECTGNLCPVITPQLVS